MNFPCQVGDMPASRNPVKMSVKSWAYMLGFSGLLCLCWMLATRLSNALLNGAVLEEV
jgi:hypothetical protein